MALCASAAAAVIGRPSAFFTATTVKIIAAEWARPLGRPSDAFSRWLFQRQQVCSVRLLRVRKKKCDGGGKKKNSSSILAAKMFRPPFLVFLGRSLHSLNESWRSVAP